MPKGTRNAASPAKRSAKIRRLTAYLYVLPALMLIVGIIYFGIGYNVWLSTLDWNGVAPDPKQVGAGNFAAIVADQTFWSSLAHVAIFCVITVIVQMVVGLVLALIFSGPIVGRTVYKVLVFIPVVLAPAAISAAFRQFFTPNGQVNQVLEAVGLGFLRQSWVADPQFALYALAAVNIFQWTGFSFMLYQAALAQIDANHLEAAQLDGAGTFRTIWHIVVPQLSPTHMTLALTGVIGSLKTFDIVYLITGGGPGKATEFLTTYIYKQAIQQFHVGYGAALSLILVGLALLLTIVQMNLYRFNQEE
jgi:raffinose/stachyose/melibiose transport system permease protein